MPHAFGFRPRCGRLVAAVLLFSLPTTTALGCEALVGIETVVAGAPAGAAGSSGCVVCDGSCQSVHSVERCGSCETACGPGEACLGGVCDRTMRAGPGARTICLRDSSGALRCRGANEFGQLGVGTVSPAEPAWMAPLLGGERGTFSVSSGDVACFRLGSGEVACAGTNARGGLGAANGSGQSPIVRPSGLLGPIHDLAAGPTTPLGSPVCALSRVSGAFCWGIGPENAGAGVTRVDLDGADVAQVEVGAGFACFLGETGSIHCRGIVGETAPSSSSELQVVPAPPARALAAGAHAACLVDGEGGVWCWGSARSGQLGEGTFVDRSTGVPVRVAASLAEPVLQVVGGAAHFCALDRAGSVLCWGDARSVGDGLAAGSPCGGGPCRTTPERVPIADIVELAAASGVTFARRRDGAIFAWGTSSAAECLLGPTCEDVTWLLPTRVELP